MKKTEAIQIHRNQVAWAKQMDVSDLDVVIDLPKYTSEVDTRANALQAKKEDHINAVLTLAEEIADCVDPEGAEAEEKDEMRREIIQ